jgi:hypothetical protein
VNGAHLVVAVAALALLAGGCGRRASGQEPGPEDPPAAAATPDAPTPDEPPEAAGDAAAAASLTSCTRLPFADSLPIAEASGAVWLPRDGGVIAVVSDSGNHGDYLLIDDEDGHVVERGQLPLGGIGDDLEGLAADGDRLWAITSSGWMRSWRPKRDGGYALEVTAFRIDEDDECTVDAVNCGHNYEGLCLGKVAGAPCDGYAVAKADGALVCLVRDGDRWRADRAHAIAVTRGDVMAACDITADGAVWTGDNLFGANLVRRIVGGEVTASAALGVGFPEAMAIAPDGTIYRFSDTSGAPSKAARFRCGGPKDAPAAAPH